MTTKKSRSKGKATKATIKLGKISIGVFLLPNGEYRFSQAQVTEAVGKPESSFRQFLRSKDPEALSCKGFRSVKFSSDNGNLPIKATHPHNVRAYWKSQYRKGNEMAGALLDACMDEALERRADKAFNVQRSEEEYNERFAFRMDLKKVKFHEFAGAIAEWERTQGIYGTNEGKQWFRDAHDQMNIRIQNIRSRQYKLENNLPKSAAIRDHFDTHTTVDYIAVTQLAANFLRSGAKDPVEAVNLACDVYFPQGYIASPAKVQENINRVAHKLAKLKQQAS